MVVILRCYVTSYIVYVAALPRPHEPYFASAAGFDRATPHASPRQRAADDVTI